MSSPCQIAVVKTGPGKLLRFLFDFFVGKFSFCLFRLGFFRNFSLILGFLRLISISLACFCRCFGAVSGCADAVRSLFWDKDWGGTIPRPT